MAPSESIQTESTSHPPASAPIKASSVRERVTGVDIRIDRAGSGKPLVILNGLLGLNEHWFGCLGPLVERSEVFLVQPPLLEMKGPGCSVDGVTRLTASVIESLTDEQVVIVGNSLGGHVGLRLAIERPELVRAIVLVGSSGLFERTFERGAEHSPSFEWLDKKIGALFHDRASMLPGMVEEAHRELSRRTSARALVRLGRSAKNDHLGERIDGLKTPTLIAWGRNDSVTPPEVAKQFNALLPQSTLRWIDKCGHAPQIERPIELANHIGAFLDDLARAEVNSGEGAEQGAA